MYNSLAAGELGRASSGASSSRRRLGEEARGSGQEARRRTITLSAARCFSTPPRPRKETASWRRRWWCLTNVMASCCFSRKVSTRSRRRKIHTNDCFALMCGVDQRADPPATVIVPVPAAEARQRHGCLDCLGGLTPASIRAAQSCTRSSRPARAAYTRRWSVHGRTRTCHQSP